MKRTVAALFIGALMVIGISGCDGTPLEDDSSELNINSYTGNTRFVTNDGHELRDVTDYEIIIDQETGVQYLFYQLGYTSGMSALVDSDGSPILADGYFNDAKQQQGVNNID